MSDRYMTEDEWFAELDPGEAISLEPEELAAVDHSNLWTICDLDGKTYIESGLVLVNRVGMYYLFQKPMADGEIVHVEVPDNDED